MSEQFASMCLHKHILVKLFNQEREMRVKYKLSIERSQPW